MLRSLHIQNYALIRSLDIQFDRGFTVITGETGAGKSILLGALSLILGTRADTSYLHDKTKKCVVEGEFDISGLTLHPFFEKNDIDYHDLTILRREIHENGKSRAFINDTPVVLQSLKELADQLVDIHSQHQNLWLNNAGFRLDVVDGFAGTRELLQEYHLIFNRYKKEEKKLQELKDQQYQIMMEKDYLEHVAKELTEVNPVVGEQEAVELKMKTLSNAETIKGKLFIASNILSEADQNILQLLKSVSRELETVAPYNASIEKLTGRLRSAHVDLEDISYELSKIGDDLPSDSLELEMLQSRLDTLYSLQQKHHVQSEEALLEKWQEIRERLSLIADNSDQIEELEKKSAALLGQLEEKAAMLSDQRSSVSGELEKAVEQKLHLLGMPDARFKIALEMREHLSEKGRDDSRFYFSANKGNPLEEVGKVASGGELSRLMLAIKSIITESALLPTVIFDEIDTGISGEIAGRVARLMKEMSRQRQLLAITHLPQITAKGSLHYHVYKKSIDGKVATDIRLLNEEERVEELAAMMSESKVTTAAREAAKELMKEQS